MRGNFGVRITFEALCPHLPFKIAEHPAVLRLQHLRDFPQKGDCLRIALHCALHKARLLSVRFTPLGVTGVQHLLHLKSKSKILQPIEIMGFFYEISCQIQGNNLL